MVNKNTQRCTKCESTLVYVRIKDPKTKVCRKCGHIEELK